MCVWLCGCGCFSTVPFEAKTEAQTSFTGVRPERTTVAKVDTTPLSPQKFLGSSEFQKSYPRHEVCVCELMMYCARSVRCVFECDCEPVPL